MLLSEQLKTFSDAITASEGDKRIIATLKLPQNIRALAGIAMAGISDKDFKRYALKFANLASTMLKHSDIVAVLDAP